MWKDPIILETRELREQYAAQFNHDMDAIFQDIQQRQKANRKKLVSFPPRRPTLVGGVVKQDNLQGAKEMERP